MVLGQLENVVVHTGRILVWNGVFRQVGSSVVQVGVRVGRDLFFNCGAPIDGLGRLD